ncbi:unnamed protein product [Bathycoccus prasinos]
MPPPFPPPPLPRGNNNNNDDCSSHQKQYRFFLFNPKESFEKKLEFCVEHFGGEMLSTTTLRTTIQTTKLREEEEEDARLCAEWTLNVLPTIVLDLDDDDNDGMTKKKKSFGKAFGSLTGGEAEAKAKSAEKLWRILLNALTICLRREETATTDNRRDGGENDDDDSDEESFSFVGEKRTAEEKAVSFNPANANRMVKCFSESMKLFAADGDGCGRNASVLSKCSDALSNVLSASKYAPSLGACTEMCVVAFERFPEMREASLRLCATQLRRKDLNIRNRNDGSNGASTTLAVSASAEKQQNVTKEFVDVLLSAGTNDNAELGKLIESAMRLTVARESVLRYYPDAFAKIKEDAGRKRKRGEKRKKETTTTPQIPAFILHFAKRITTAKDSHAIRFAPWFFQEFCASKERKRNAAITKKITEKALRDMREVFSKLFGGVTSASSKEKGTHIVHLLRALKTKEDVYEAYDDSNPPKVAIESFLVECFDGRKAIGCISRVGMNGTTASTFLLNFMAAFATRRKLAEFVDCVGHAFKRVPNESEDELCGMNALFRSELVLKALESHTSSMLEGQREELFEVCAKILGMQKSTRLLTTFGMVVKSIHKGMLDSFTLEQCDKLGRNVPQDWAIYDAMAISPVVGDVLMNNRALFDRFIEQVRELRTTDDFISIFPCAMQALSNDNVSNDKAWEIIECILTDENKKDAGTDMRYDLLHQYSSTWIPRASTDQAKRYFGSRIKHRKFAALVDDLVSATLWIDALREWLGESTTNMERTLVDAMEALELQMNSLFSRRKVTDEKEIVGRFFASMEAVAIAAEEIVSKLANKRKAPSSLKTILRVRSAVDARKIEEDLSPSEWPHRESTREALGKIVDSIPESAWLSYLEEYASASYSVSGEDENLFQLSRTDAKNMCFKDAMTLAVACKQTRDVTCDGNDDEAMAAWVQKFKKREELFESLVVKLESDASTHAMSVCFGFILAGLGHSLHARAKIFSSLSPSSTVMKDLMRTSSDSVASHLDRALCFVKEELKGDLNTNTKAMTYLCGCVSLLASPGIAFETEAFTVVFNALLKNFEHFSSSHTVKGAEMVLNELHRERTKCLRMMFESSSKEARRFAVQFAVDRLHREDSLARNAFIGGVDDNALLSAQNQRLHPTFWMLEVFTSCSKFAWRKTFDDEKNEALVDSLLHACEPHLNKDSRCLNRRRSLAILCNIVAKGDYECALSARVVGRIAHVSARAFSGALLETQETDFDSFVLCCDIVTATMYHRKEQLKRSTNIITATIAHLVDVLRQWASMSSTKIEHHDDFIRCASNLSKSLVACKASGLKQFYCAHILAEVIASVTATSENRKIESTTGNEKNNEIFSSIRERLKPGIFKLFEACSDLELSYIFAMYGDKGVGGARRVAFSTLREEQKLAI